MVNLEKRRKELEAYFSSSAFMVEAGTEVPREYYFQEHPMTREIHLLCTDHVTKSHKKMGDPVLAQKILEQDAILSAEFEVYKRNGYNLVF